jgi:hypothetical protein
MHCGALQKYCEAMKACDTRCMNGAVGSPVVPRASLGRKILRGLGIFVVLFVILFVAGVIWRMPIVAEQDRSAEVVKQIEKAHLTLADADGSHLPPKLDDIRANATVEGVDANANGIRDDVELAIYAKYPITSATSSASSTKPVDTNLKLRAAELQYAKALQMYLTSVFTEETMRAVMSVDSRASLCLSEVLTPPAQEASDSIWNDFFHKIDALDKEVEDLVINIDSRRVAREKAFDYMTSGGGAQSPYCDVL